jgi:hypothetical protein
MTATEAVRGRGQQAATTPLAMLNGWGLVAAKRQGRITRHCTVTEGGFVFCFHSLRHCCPSNLDMSDVPPPPPSRLDHDDHVLIGRCKPPIGMPSIHPLNHFSAMIPNLRPASLNSPPITSHRRPEGFRFTGGRQLAPPAITQRHRTRIRPPRQVLRSAFLCTLRHVLSVFPVSLFSPERRGSSRAANTTAADGWGGADVLQEYQQQQPVELQALARLHTPPIIPPSRRSSLLDMPGCGCRCCC